MAFPENQCRAVGELFGPDSPCHLERGHESVFHEHFLDEYGRGVSWKSPEPGP